MGFKPKFEDENNQLRDLTVIKKTEEDTFEDLKKQLSMFEEKRTSLTRLVTTEQDMSPAKAHELKSVLGLLRQEKDKLIFEMRSKIAFLEILTL